MSEEIEQEDAPEGGQLVPRFAHTVAEVAVILERSEFWVADKIRSGELKTVRIADTELVLASALREFVRRPIKRLGRPRLNRPVERGAA